MPAYIALLRGINVGGHNKIKMVDLRKTFESMGLLHVKTYIQSGNVLFESSEEESLLCRQIERAIDKEYAISLSVVLRTAEQWEQIIINCPFTEAELKEAEGSTEAETFYVVLMPELPSKEHVEQLMGLQNQKECIQFNGRDAYLLLHDSIRHSKLANQFNKLNVPTTVRNWKTMNKLNDLVKA